MAVMLCTSACTKPEETIGSNNGGSTIPVENKRIIVYTVDSDEGARNLQTDSEWDAMLDLFCEYAVEGKVVKFYNMSTQTRYSKNGSASKDATTFTTRDRQEMKDWMKTMEKAGKTVCVSYDPNSGTYYGSAYATLPYTLNMSNCYTGVMECVEVPETDDYTLSDMVPALRISEDSVLILIKDGYTMVCGGDMEEDTITLCGTVETRHDIHGDSYLVLDISAADIASLAGTWSLEIMTITQAGNTTVQSPANGETILYEFEEDGTASLTRESGVEIGSWSLSDNGEFCCGLLPTDGCWSIHWLTDSTLIMSRTDYETENIPVIYMIQFSKWNN